MNKRTMIRDLLAFDNTDENCPVECGPDSVDENGKAIWPDYCTLFTYYDYADWTYTAQCDWSNGNYRCSIMQCLSDMKRPNARLFQLSKRQLRELHMTLIY